MVAVILRIQSALNAFVNAVLICYFGRTRLCTKVSGLAGRLERGLQMVQLSAARCSFIAIL
jgi:hypothetical protein